MTYPFPWRAVLSPILIGGLIGVVLASAIIWYDATSWRAYRAEHHCEKSGEQTRFGIVPPAPYVETTYVCDGGKVVVR